MFFYVVLLVVTENMSAAQSYELFTHRGFRMISGTHIPQEVDLIPDMEIRDSDVFVVTYPKSGDIFMQLLNDTMAQKGKNHHMDCDSSNSE